MAKLIVGSRDSALAMWQTNWIIAELKRHKPDLEFEIVNIKTEGDRDRNTPLALLGGRGLFVKEIENALLENKIDIAVHSLKDMPSVTPPGLAIAAITEREDPRDVFITRLGLKLADMPQGSKIGTSSIRRSAQLRHFRPDFETLNLRGNVDTRLRKAETEEYDGIILAAAGVLRLGYADRISEYVPVDICLPAIGQGALGIETRDDDETTKEVVSLLNHRSTYLACTAERAFLSRLAGGCQVPIGAYGVVDGETLVLEGVVASVDGVTVLRTKVIGSASSPVSVGVNLMESLLEMGAAEILDQMRS